ncbi:MAG: hypothetical protein LBN97_02225 [Oscillospiraceae bacterium]|jgi:predicted PP-loop superfamily ATPase|nr:hypothetical protein [Oscillospiraceae bacterium]
MNSETRFQFEKITVDDVVKAAAAASGGAKASAPFRAVLRRFLMQTYYKVFMHRISPQSAIFQLALKISDVKMAPMFAVDNYTRNEMKYMDKQKKNNTAAAGAPTFTSASDTAAMSNLFDKPKK